MATKVFRALNPFNWFSSNTEKSYEEDSEEEYDNPEHSPWKDRRKLKDEESEIFGKHFEADFLDTQYDRETVMWDIRDRKNDLSNLHVQIRTHWEKYKHWLEQAKEEGGIDEIKAKTRAKSAKKAAKDKEKLYKLLWKELSSLKNSLRKDEQVRILSGDKYEVSFTDIDSASAEEAAQRHSQVMRERKMMVEQFQKGVARTEEDVEIDFSDIEKDVAELEMQDFDVYFEDGVESEIPEQTPETGEDWS